MKQEKRKQSYQPPQLTVVTFATERGFAGSVRLDISSSLSSQHNFSVGESRQNGTDNIFGTW